jgi:transposase
MRAKASAERFIEVWQDSKSIREVCDRLSMGHSTCNSRASRYRKKGVPLQTFGRTGRPRKDWDKLATLALNGED